MLYHSDNQQDANDLMIMITTILQLLTCLMATPASRQIISRLHSSKASTGNYHDIGTAIDDSDDDDCNDGGDVDDKTVDEKNDNAEKKFKSRDQPAQKCGCCSQCDPSSHVP